MSDTVQMDPAALTSLIEGAMVASNIRHGAAVSIARALVQAEIDGHGGHGLSRVPGYSAQALAGKVDGQVQPELIRPREASLMIDCRHGFAYPAFDMAIAELPEIARRFGIAAAGFTRSHHFGVAGQHVERLADAGLVSIVCGNTPKGMAPWGGTKPVFGTNPIAFGAPIPGEAPLVIDMALTQVARGHIMRAAQKGEPIPAGWAFDADGQPTTDADLALKGTLNPVGGAKGAALALMVEVLAVALTGATPSTQASSFFDTAGGPPGVGQFLIAIDPDGFGGAARFGEQIAAIAQSITGQDGVRLPGQRRLARRAETARSGIPLDPKLVAEAEKIAGGR